MTGKKRKPGQGDTASFKGEFSFVNKDASNIKSKDHNAAVSWHMVNRYEKWKKQNQANKLRASNNVPLWSDPPAQTPDMRVGTASTWQAMGRSTLTRAKQQDEQISHTFYPTNPWQMKVKEQSAISYDNMLTTQEDRLRSSTPSSSSSSPYEVAEAVDGGRFRPQHFDLRATLLEAAHFPPLVTRILSYAYSVAVPTTWPSEIDKSTWLYEIAHTCDNITTINDDSCYASATLCYYATLMANATNDPDLASLATFFQTQAMSELRQRVSSQTGDKDPFTLKAMLRLFSAETALDNSAVARIHLKMLRSTVNAEGGVISLDSWFRENLLAADCYFALKHETRPLFPASEWTPGPIRQAWKARLVLARVVEDHAPGVDAIVDPNLKIIITDLRELFKVERYVNKNDLAMEDQILRWRTLRKFDCISRLADYQLSVKIYPHLFTRPKLQSALCVAISLMAAMVLGSPEPVRFGLKLVIELRTKFAEAQRELLSDEAFEGTKNCTNAMFWLLYVGMIGEQIHTVPSEATWFRQELATMAEQFGLLNQQDQQAVVRLFLHSPALIEEIKHGRAFRMLELMKGVYEACGMSWRLPVDFQMNQSGDREEAGSSRKRSEEAQA